MNIDLIKILISIACATLIGFEREHNDKPAGLRTIIFITFGATLITIFSLKFVEVTKELGVTFDAIRAIAYYLVGVGLGGVIVSRNKGQTEGITTTASLFPMTGIGFLCGISEYRLAIVSTCLVFLILMSKYIRAKFKDNMLKVGFRFNKTQIRRRKKKNG